MPFKDNISRSSADSTAAPDARSLRASTNFTAALGAILAAALIFTALSLSAEDHGPAPHQPDRFNPPDRTLSPVLRAGVGISW